MQATLSDKRYVQKGALTATDSLRKGFAASVSSLYDYYPFGMLMQERCTSDTGTQTAYVSQVVYSPAITTVNNAMNGATVLNPNSSVQSSGNGSITYSGTTNGGALPAQAGIKKVLSNLVPNVPVSVKINLVYASASMYIAVQEGIGQSSNLLYSTMTNGSVNFTFVPTQSSVELSMELLFNKVPLTAFSYSFTLDSVSYMQQTGANSSTQLVQISNKVGDKYRFGFNGQEKDNEIAGVGNHVDFGDRGYDVRRGQWWSRDRLAITYPSHTPYCFVGNMPTIAIDPDGKKIYFINPNSTMLAAKNILIQTKSGREIWEKYNNSKTDDIYIKSGIPVVNVAETYYNISRNSFVNNKGIIQFNNKAKYSAFRTFNGLDISKSGGKTVSLVVLNTNSETGFFSDNCMAQNHHSRFSGGEQFNDYDNAESIYHELKAHIELSHTKDQHYAYGSISSGILNKNVKHRNGSPAQKFKNELIDLYNNLTGKDELKHDDSDKGTHKKEDDNPNIGGKK